MTLPVEVDDAPSRGASEPVHASITVERVHGVRFRGHRGFCWCCDRPRDVVQLHDGIARGGHGAQCDLGPPTCEGEEEAAEASAAHHRE